MGRKPMTMVAWISKLDDFLRLGDREVLTHAGKVSAELARLRAAAEYEEWRARAIEAPTAAEKHFVEAIGKAKTLSRTVQRPLKREI